MNPRRLKPDLGKDNEPVSSDLQGIRVRLDAVITYPGSRVTDVLIGNQTVQLQNETLRKAVR